MLRAPLSALLLVLAASCGDAPSEPGVAAGALPSSKLPFLRNEPDYLQHDPDIGHVHKPMARREIGWKEHPEGKIVMATNNLGFRKDVDTAEEPAAGVVRVLTVGDSHLDGVMNNAETFPNVLEGLLNASGGPVHWEVLNGGVGYYGFQHYRAFFEKYRRLRPAAFFVVVFTGNDYLDAGRGIESQGPPRKRPPGYVERMRKAFEISGPAVSQGLGQVAYYKGLPEMRAPAMAYVEEQLAAIASRAKEDGVRLLVILWPSLVDVQRELDRDKVREAIEALALTKADLTLTRGLVEELEDWMDAQGIAFLDLRERFDREPEPCFWVQDYHMNPRGHAITAEAVLESCRALLDDLAAKR